MLNTRDNALVLSCDPKVKRTVLTMPVMVLVAEVVVIWQCIQLKAAGQPWTLLAGFGAFYFVSTAILNSFMILRYQRTLTLDPKKFVLRKTLMWLPGTLMALLVCTFCVCMPFGSPVMNTPYMCFIAGYGVVMALSYRKGKFKGTSGKLPRLSWKAKWDWATAAIALGLCLYLWLALRATMYLLVPLNFRMFWLAFATLVMTVGYYVSGCETDMLERAGASRKVRLAYNLIQYVPLFLLVAFYLVLRSYSGLIGQVQNMVLMYIFCIPLGSFVKKRTGSRLVGAVLTAFLFQTLMITSAALISMF